jgi:hypothetical protein
MITLYQVDITQIPADMIGMTKALRVIGKMPLRKAWDVAQWLAGSGGGTVAAGLELSVAESIVRELERANVAASINESSVKSPVSADPAAATAFEWGSFRRLIPSRR